MIDKNRFPISSFPLFRMNALLIDDERLARNETQQAGLHGVSWQAREQRCGVYFVRLSANGETHAGKIINPIGKALSVVGTCVGAFMAIKPSVGKFASRQL